MSSDSDRNHSPLEPSSSRLAWFVSRVGEVLLQELWLWTARRFSMTNKARYALSRLRIPTVHGVKWGGHFFRSDNLLGLLLLPGYLREANYLLDFIQKRDEPLKILDIGANVGQFIHTFAVLADVQAVCFEPNPSPFRILQANVSQLDGKIKCLQIAIGPTATRDTLYYVPGKSAQGSFSSRHSINHLPRAHQEKLAGITVSVEALSEALLIRHAVQISKFDLLKIDVEGHDLEALAGCREIDFDYLWIELLRASDTDGDLETFVRDVEDTLGRPTQLIMHSSQKGPNGNLLFRVSSTAGL